MQALRNPPDGANPAADHALLFRSLLVLSAVVFRNTTVPKDRFGQGEIQVWSGPLYGGDYVLLLVNAADTDEDVTTYLEDIFVSEGPGGSAPQSTQAWTVHDLWATRMDNQLAQQIINNARSLEKKVEDLYNSVSWYNSTVESYADGLKKSDHRLLGSDVGKIQAYGSWTVSIPRHAAKVYRLRSESGSTMKGYSIYRGEL